jgi:CRP/FNR family nitrogen fixation transcriptional regulator
MSQVHTAFATTSAHQAILARAAAPQPANQNAFSRDGLADLKAVGTICRFTRNETIFAEGDDANYAYKIVSGAVRLLKLMPDGRRHIAGFPLLGDLFGMEWGEKHALTAEAVSDVVAIRCARTHLDRLGEERADIRHQLMARLQRDLHAAQIHLVSLGCQSAKERVVSFLLLLAERAGTKDGEAVPLPMGRQDIADYLGLTIETVCRTLSDLKAAKLITIPNRHEVGIRSLGILQAVAGSDT